MNSKKYIVISLGGSLIIPENINFKFLEEFRKALRKNYKNYKFAVVCGGGSIARKYISALKEEHLNEKTISMAGIRATRMNALFLTQFFGKEANTFLPRDMQEVKSNLLKNNVVFCGALRYAPKETSDGTAAKLAHFLKCPFINLTDVSGLYTDNPKKNKNAKFIEEITWKEFENKALKLKFEAGQHFVLDQEASKIIRKNKIKTYILGNNMKNLDSLLKGNKFKGTTIQD